MVFCQGYSLDDIMGAGDQQVTGVASLDEQERATLEQWLTLWTTRAINQVISSGCNCTTQACLSALLGRTGGDSASVQLDSVMTMADQASTGVAGLTSEGRAGLEEWINLWTVKAINQVLSMGCKCTAQECLAALIGGGASYPTDPTGLPLARRNAIVQEEQVDYTLLTDNVRNGG